MSEQPVRCMGDLKVGFNYRDANFFGASRLTQADDKEVVLMFSGDFYRGAILQIVQIGHPDIIIWNKQIMPVDLPPQGKLTNLLREFQTVADIHTFLRNIKFDQAFDQMLNQAFTTRQ